MPRKTIHDIAPGYQVNVDYGSEIRETQCCLMGIVAAGYKEEDVAKLIESGDYYAKSTNTGWKVGVCQDDEPEPSAIEGTPPIYYPDKDTPAFRTIPLYTNNNVVAWLLSNEVISDTLSTSVVPISGAKRSFPYTVCGGASDGASDAKKAKK